MALQFCGDNYCGTNKSTIDGDCHDLDYQPGNKIVLQGPGIPFGRCYCVCSCLAKDTPVSISKSGHVIKVQDIKKDHTTVIAAGTNLNFKDRKVETFSKGAKGTTHNTIYLEYQIEGEDESRKIIITRDHFLYLNDLQKFVPADWLTIDDKLTDQDGNVVHIRDIHWGSYDGDFYEFATDMERPEDGLDGHLVVTNGIVTGDFCLQVWLNQDGELRNKYVVKREMGEVGSQEWLDHYHSVKGDNADAPKTIELNGIEFITSKGHEVIIPEQANQFIPTAQALYLQKHAKKKPIGDNVNLQMLEYIEGNLKCKYPDINFIVNWYDNRVNAHSWIDISSPERKKYTYIAGGLARIDGFNLEGLYFAFAQQIGMFYGSPLEPETGMTCIGEGDYYGAKIVLRKVWFYEEYLNRMELVKQQLRTFFGYLGKQEMEEIYAESGTYYPSILCRFKTIDAAEALQEIPQCAVSKN
jgi:hypothetical protein